MSKKVFYGFIVALVAFGAYFFGSQSNTPTVSLDCDSTKCVDSLKDSCKTADTLSDTTFQVTP